MAILWLHPGGTPGTAPRRMPLRFNADALVLAIGSPRLNGMLFDQMRAEFAIEHAVFLQKRGNEPVSVVFARNAHDSSLTGELCNRYTSHYHFRDPVLAALAPARRRELQVCSVSAPDISDPGYRSRLFLEPDFAGKISIISRNPNHLLYLNFYRRRQDGAFRDGELHKLNTCSSLVAAIVEKHLMLTAPQDHSLQSLINILQRVATGASLSPRELATCARIAMGLPIERIAAELGISKNSAITFRRRAFAKLNIGTHKDLYWLLLRNQHLFGGEISPAG